MVKFGDVVRQVGESVRDPAKEGLDRVVGLEHIDSDDLHIKRWDDIGEGTSFSKRFRKGQVLFGRRRAYLRKVAYAEFDGICSGDITVMEPSGEKLLPELLPFLVQTDGFYEHTQKVSAGGLSPRAKWRDLAGYEFALPPIPEQRRIAEILWAAERASEGGSATLAAIERVYDASVEELTEGDAAALATAPRLRDVSEINSETLTERTPAETQIEYIDISTVLDSKMLGIPQRMTFGEAPSRARRVIHAGDILLSTVRPYFRAFVYIDEAAPGLTASTGFAVVRPKRDIDGRFLFHAFFTRRFLRHCRGYMTGTNYPAVTAANIAKYRLHVPSSSSQRESAKALDAMDAARSAAARTLQSSNATKRALLKQLLGSPDA